MPFLARFDLSSQLPLPYPPLPYLPPLPDPVSPHHGAPSPCCASSRLTSAHLASPHPGDCRGIPHVAVPGGQHHAHLHLRGSAAGARRGDDARLGVGRSSPNGFVWLRCPLLHATHLRHRRTYSGSLPRAPDCCRLFTPARRAAQHTQIPPDWPLISPADVARPRRSGALAHVGSPTLVGSPALVCSRLPFPSLPSLPLASIGVHASP